MTFHSTAFRRVTEPTLIPVSLAEFKVFARIDVDAEDTILCAFLAAATDAAERWTRRAFIRQSWQMRFSDWPDDGTLILPRPPVIDITKVATLNANGTENTVVCASSYFTVQEGCFGRLVFVDGAPALVPTITAPYLLSVTWRAGYGTSADDVPVGIRQGIYFWAAAMYEGRAPAAAPPEIAVSLLRRYRVPIL